MKRLSKFLVRNSKKSLFGFIALILISSFWGFQSFGALKSGGYDDPGSESASVAQMLRDDFDQASAEVVMVIDFADGADLATSQETTKNLVAEIETVDGVEDVTSYYTLGSPASLRSDDGKAIYVFVDLDDQVKQAVVGQQIMDEFAGKYETGTVYVAGYAAVNAAINGSIQSDLAAAESVAIPLTVVLLVFVFGSLVAAGLPLMVGGLAIVGSFFFVWVSTQFTDTSIFALNLITGLGLGLGIDYALLMVNRFREERAASNSVENSVRKTVETAGRTVLFSGLTVAIVLASMAFFPQYFLKSFALGGVVVVILAVAGALIALPAMLNLIGDKVNSIRFKRSEPKPSESGAWAAVARFVMKRPVPILLVTLIGLGGLVSLGNGVQFGQVDDRILQQSNPVVVANNLVRERFSGREGSPVEIIIEGATQDDITEYAISLSTLPNIVRVQSTSGIASAGQLDDGYAPAFAAYEDGKYQRIVAIHDIESRSPAGVELTDAIRKLTANGHKILVGGSAAVYTDSQRGIEHALPLVITWIVLFTLLLLFLFTGSVLLPIKAVILNILSLGATLGFITWVFMGGHLKWLIGDFFVTGTVDTSTTVLIAVVAFGLSMDYELFLLSRIKEQHDAGLGTTESVAVGLQKSGRIITAAALVLAFSFIGFTTSGVTIMKALGLGIAFAILLDATVVRALLVPALMRLFGQANWWAPRWLKKIYKKVGLDH